MYRQEALLVHCFSEYTNQKLQDLSQTECLSLDGVKIPIHPELQNAENKPRLNCSSLGRQLSASIISQRL
jgi:hypothetical protein